MDRGQLHQSSSKYQPGCRYYGYSANGGFSNRIDSSYYPANGSFSNRVDSSYYSANGSFSNRIDSSYYPANGSSFNQAASSYYSTNARGQSFSIQQPACPSTSSNVYGWHPGLFPPISERNSLTCFGIFPSMHPQTSQAVASSSANVFDDMWYVTMTPAQNEVLEHEFLSYKKPSKDKMEEIAIKIGLTKLQTYKIKHWFKNRRSKFKQEQKSLRNTATSGN